MREGVRSRNPLLEVCVWSCTCYAGAIEATSCSSSANGVDTQSLCYCSLKDHKCKYNVSVIASSHTVTITLWIKYKRGTCLSSVGGKTCFSGVVRGYYVGMFSRLSENDHAWQVWALHVSVGRLNEPRVAPSERVSNVLCGAWSQLWV